MMAALMYVLVLVPAVYSAVIGGYLLAVTIAAHWPRRYPPAEESPLSFGVIVPAHNEESQIETTLKAVLAQEYSRDKYAVYVLADNCTDGTAEAARHAGAVVFERSDESNRGKGQALDWCFSNHPEVLMRHDAVVILDADSTMDARFLAAMAGVLKDESVAAVQAHNSVANPEVNWRTALTYAGFALINCVRPAGRIRLRGSAGLKGNGMAFRTQLLARYGWPAHSVVEDIEFGLRLLLDGHYVTYSDAARVTSDMPSQRREADSQRNRWEAGKVAVAGHFVPVLLRAFVTSGQWRYLDACLDLATPPLAILAFSQAVFLVVSAIIAPDLFPVFVFSTAATALHVVLGLRLARAPRSVWVSLLAAPFFLAWKLSLYAGFLLRPREKGWVRTPREAEIRARRKETGD